MDPKLTVVEETEPTGPPVSRVGEMRIPVWFDELTSGLSTLPNVAISGNLRDLYPVVDGDQVAFLSFEHILWRLAQAQNFKALVFYDSDGGLRYGFIHGNWALDNSHPDGRHCGVNQELGVLASTGCYADFTLPSAPNRTQTHMINSIYRALDTPRPKSHDDGELLRAGQPQTLDGTSLLLIQGPLGLNWRRRKWGVLPRLENADLAAKVAAQIYDNCRAAAGLLEDPRVMIQRMNELLEQTLSPKS